MTERSVAFLGGGKMGRALISGLIRSGGGAADEIMVTCRDEDGLPGPIPGDRRVQRMKTGQSGEDVHSIYTLESLNTTFTRPGWYQFSVHVDGELIEELPVHVSKSARR